MDVREKNGHLTVVILDGEECVKVEKIDKATLGKAEALDFGIPINIKPEEDKPGKIKESFQTVGNGIATGAKAAVIGVQSGASFLGKIVSGIKDGIQDAAVEYDRRAACKAVKEAAEKEEKYEKESGDKTNIC